MGVRGPTPKRVSQRLGVVTKADRAAVDTIHVIGPVKVPPADRSWHRIARDWYLSLKDSGQAQHYEPSDWQAARFVAFEMSRMLNGEFISPTMFKAIWSAMSELMTTEGARRRLKVEVERRSVSAVPAAVAALDDYRGL